MTSGAAAVASNSKETNEDQIFSMLFNEDELAWQTIILELIKSEKMDPWDIDVSTIAEKFIQLLSEMKRMDFRISGKIIGAAAFFLKIKSDKLLNEDISALDNLIHPLENEELMDMIDHLPLDPKQKQRASLLIRSPQPRKRKVSVFDLIAALEKAMQTDVRRTFYRLPEKKTVAPEKKKATTAVMVELYDRIKKALESINTITFRELLQSQSREDKITTFGPLLYLDTQRKIDISQQQHFGDISITLVTKPN